MERAEQKGKALTEPRASAADDPMNYFEAPAPGESSQDQILEAWAAEAVQGDHENRQEAVRRTKAWQEAAPHEPPWPDLSLLSLTTLPAALPAGLQHLNIDGNQLTSVPDILPSGLQTLHARNNWLANLPTNLPASVECLRASGNRLTRLPATPSRRAPAPVCPKQSADQPPRNASSGPHAAQRQREPTDQPARDSPGRTPSTARR